MADRDPVSLAVEQMFAKQAATNPDPELLSEEKALLVVRVHEYVDLQEAANHVLHDDVANSKARIIIVSFCYQRTDHNPIFYVKKGRISNNGSAQIGRTWELLSLVKMDAPNPAGPLLIITFRKPYYWVFESAKDRQDFETVVNDTYKRAKNLKAKKDRDAELLEQQRQQQLLHQQQLQQQHLQQQQQQLERERDRERALEKQEAERQEKERERQEQERERERQDRERIEREREMARQMEMEREREHMARLERERREMERQLELEQELAARDAERQVSYERELSPLSDTPPPVPAVSRKRTVSRARVVPEPAPDDELNFTSFDAPPAPPPHVQGVARQNSLPRDQMRQDAVPPLVAPLRMGRAASRSYRPPLQPPDGAGFASSQSSQSSLAPSPLLERQTSVERQSSVERQTSVNGVKSEGARRSDDRRRGDDARWSGEPRRSLDNELARRSSIERASPLRSPRMRKSPSLELASRAGTPGVAAPVTRSAAADLYAVLRESSFPETDLAELEKATRMRLDAISEQTFSSVISVDRHLLTVDKFVARAISECEAVDGQLQGVALELFGKTDNRGMKALTGPLAGGRAGNGFGAGGGEGGGDQVTALKCRQLAADIEKLLDVSRLDDAFVAELTQFQFSAPSASKQGVSRLNFVESLLVSLSQALEMFTHRANASSSSTMQAFLEPKRTADDLAVSFARKFQAFAEQEINGTMQMDSAAALDTLMPYAGCMLFVKECVPSLYQSMLNSYMRHARHAHEQKIQRELRQWTVQLQQIASARASPGAGGNSSAAAEAVPLSTPKVREACAHYARLCDDIMRTVAAQQTFLEQVFFVGSSAKLAKFVASHPVAKRSGAARLLAQHVSELQFSDIDQSSSWGVERLLASSVFPSLVDALRTALTAVVQDTSLEFGFLIMLFDLRAHETRRTSQQFLASVLETCRKQLADSFEQFVGQQTRSVLSSTFVTNRRVGVHARVAQFTKIIAANELALAEALKLKKSAYEGAQTRKLIDQCYSDIFRALAQGLKVDAAPTAPIGGHHAAINNLVPATGVDESKEVLNYHVVMIENMYRIVHDLEPLASASPGLTKIVDNARAYFERELHAYAVEVISKRMSKIQKFLRHVDSGTKDGVSDFKRTVKQFDSKDVRSAIESTKKRVEKHFQDTDRAVLATAWEAVGAEYLSMYTRLAKIGQKYDAFSAIPFSRNDIVSNL